MNRDIHKVAIIGAGPAGIACAIQLKRHGIDPLVFEEDKIGGLLVNANLVENYPGFPDGISGVELVSLFEKHLKSHNVKVMHELVNNVQLDEDMFLINTDLSGYYSEILVIASGTKPIEFQLNVKHEDLDGRVFSEVYPIRNVKDKDVAIIGAGDAAFDYALTLSPENRVSIFNRGNIIKCIKALHSRFEKDGGIEYHENHKLTDCQIAGEKLLLTLKTAEGETEKKFDYLITAIGRESSTDFLSQQIADKIEALWEEKRLFFIGDVVNKNYRQTVISAGEGVKTAMQIYEKLRGA